MFGAFGRARFATSMTFVLQAAASRGAAEYLRLKRMIGGARDCGNLRKCDMINNSHLPHIEVDPQTI